MTTEETRNPLKGILDFGGETDVAQGEAIEVVELAVRGGHGKVFRFYYPPEIVGKVVAAHSGEGSDIVGRRVLRFEADALAVLFVGVMAGLEDYGLSAEGFAELLDKFEVPGGTDAESDD